MRKLHLLHWCMLVFGVGVGVSVLAFVAMTRPAAVAAAPDDQKPFDKVPEGQKYVGAKVCGACHFDQLLTWKMTKHAKGFEILPAKYQEDKSCLKCHATGLGDETGFKSVEATPDLVGASCESCHGPGSKHSELAKPFTGKKLTEAQDKFVRSSIHKMQPKNVCVDCHLTRAHKKHPPYDKDK